MIKKGIVYIILSIVLFSCCKEKEIELKCPPYEGDKNPIDVRLFNGPQFKSPDVNPNNPNEFVYYYRFQDDRKLIKYNIATNTKTTLVENFNIGTQPKWGNNNKIVFDNANDYQLRIVDTDGSNLQQITNNDFNLFPEWNKDGDKVYWQRTMNLGVPYTLLEYSFTSNQIDTIIHNVYHRTKDISIDNKLFMYMNIFEDNLISIDLEDNNTISILDTLSIRPSGLCWSHDAEKAYYNIAAEGIYELDISTGASTLLVGSCETKKFIYIAATSDGKYLIVERENTFLDDDGFVNIQSRIYKINLQTLEETEIDLF